jgi:hypothetical protein
MHLPSLAPPGVCIADRPALVQLGAESLQHRRVGFELNFTGH